MRSVAKKELDCKNRVLNRVSPYLPPSIIQQLHKKPDISALDAIRLLSLLPPEAYEDFPDMPQVPLTFPRDHNRHYFQAHEWFYLAMNLQSVEDPEIPGSKRRIGALSTIAGHTLDPPDPALFALEKTNQLFRHSFSLTLGATDSSPCEHWYIRDQGGFIGDYRPAVHNELPVLSFLAKEPTGKDDSDWDKMNDDEHGVIEQGLLPYTEEEDDDEEHRDAGRRQSVDAHLKKMRWVVHDPVSGAMIDVVLTIPDDSSILLQGPSGTGTIVMPDAGINYMYYSFPYLKVNGTVTFPANDGGEPRTTEVTGAAWLDHQGGVVKAQRGLVKHVDEWKNLLNMPAHRLAWIWVMIQFPHKSIYITGAAMGLHPAAVKKEAVFPWKGSVTTGKNTDFFTDGKLTVKAVFQSPSMKSIFYASEVEVAVGNNVYSLKCICPDQRTFPADQGEIYEGAADAEILSDNRTVKPKGVGFIENMAFSTYRQLEEQQLGELGIAPLVGNFEASLSGTGTGGSVLNKSTTGPVIVITCVVLAIVAAAGFIMSRKR